MKIMMPVVALIVAFGACSKKPDTTDVKPSATPTATATQAAGPVAKYHVFDNGVRCVVGPCPSWTAKTKDGTEVKITNIDLSALGFEVQKEIDTRTMMMSGYMVSATVVAGPDGPGGKGTTLKVKRLHEALKKP